MARIYSDQSRQVDWTVRQNTDAVLTLTITSNNSAFDISSYTFIAEIFKLGINTPLISLTQGVGITNGGATGILTLALTDTQLTIDHNKYFWKLRTTAPTDYLWFNGVFTVNGYIWDGGTNYTAAISLNLASSNINLSIVSASVSGGGGGGHTIEDEGTPLTQRTKLNFVGAGVTVTDDSGDDTTVVTIPSSVLSNGNGTTANGTSADLGGAASADIDIDPDTDETHTLIFGNANRFLNISTYSQNTSLIASDSTVNRLSGLTANKDAISIYNYNESGVLSSFVSSEPDRLELKADDGVNSKSIVITPTSISITGFSGSGTVNSGTQYRIPYYSTNPSGTVLDEAASITGARALKSDANGVPTHFDTATEPSLAELARVKGVTSAIQTQINNNPGANLFLYYNYF